MRKIYALLVLLLMGAQQYALSQPYCLAPTTTVAITPTGSVQNTAVYNSGVRAFSFVATAGCTYNFSTCGLSSSDTYLRLYSASAVLVLADDQCGLQSTINWLCPANGTYYVLLTNFSCVALNANTSMSYSVSGCPLSNTVPFSGNNSYTLCSGNLYDHGGPSGNYNNNANGFTVLNPSTAGNLVQLTGTINTEANFDFVTIFDGSGTGGPILFTGSGNQTIPTITSTTGPLTVRFTSDGSVTGVGFDLSINCIPDPNILVVPFSGNNSYTVCSGNLYDHGGPSGNYANNANGFTVLNPSTPGTGIQVSGTTAGEGCCDFLTIFDGVGTGGPVLWTGVANAGAVPLVTSTTGPLTVRFTSDGSVVGAGFNLSINCVPICAPSIAPTSISGITNICVGGSTTLTAVGGLLEPGGTVEWFTGSCGGSPAGTGPSITVSPASSTDYFVRYTGPCGTSACASTNVNVSSPPVLTITGQTDICPGSSTTLTVNGVSSAPTLQNVLTAINSNSASLIASIPTPSGFNMDQGVNSYWIIDGCADMYDGGNIINTNIQNQINYSDNAVIPSAAFGSGGSYFTRYLGPGGCQTGPATIFYMAADVNNITSLSITGNLGADGGGIQQLATFSVTANGVTYDCFLKRVYNAGDPSVNQIFMIPQTNSVTQSMGGTTDDGLHALANLNGVTRVYYMLYAGANGALIDNAQATGIAQTFANIIPTSSTYVWSPGGETTESITVTPAVNTTYTVDVTSGPCSASTSQLVTLTSPTEPTVSASVNPICAGSSTDLNGTAVGQINWYDAPTGGTLLGTTNSGDDFTVSPTSTTTYYAETEAIAAAGNTTLTYTGSIQQFVVPAGVTEITIEARGAQGGNGSAAIGGLGAMMTGTFAVTPGQVLDVLVGQQPVGSNGGGGGTFVVNDADNSPLIVAGGGGGGAGTCCGTVHQGAPGTITVDGTAGINASGGTGAGGVGGNGGGVGADGQNGGAGGGFFTNGANGFAGSTGGQSYLNGGAGALTNSPGGFGGGGGSHCGSVDCAGGGGGGYSGGGSTGGGGQWGGGGGGGSFNAGTNQNNMGGVQSGNGLVTITYNGPTGCTSAARTPITIDVDAPSVAPTSINNLQANVCNGGSTELELVGGSLADGAQWEWFSVSCGGTAEGTGNIVSVSPPANNTEYFVRAGAGTTCAPSACASIIVNLPATSTDLSIDGDVATCYVNSGNWIHFYDANARLIASVNSNGQDLGDVTATTYVASNPFIIPSCTQPWDPSWFNAALARSFVITPTTQPTSPVSVRLYILDSEFNDYQATALSTTDNGADDVATITDMDMTKHSGTSQDGDPLNNCGGGSTIYVPQSGSGLTSAVMGGFSGSYYIQYSIDGFSEMFPMNSANSPLPVTLTSFNANCDGDKVNITWTTATELNASHYSLQTSRDGQTWTEVAEIAAAGTTNQTSNYFYQDFMFGGISYYRLVQVDFDGTQEVYGPIISNCTLNENNMTVYPNPTDADFTVLIQTMETFENATIELVDLSGRSVEVKEMNILPGSTTVKFETKNINPGTYIVRIKGENDKFIPLRVVIM